jgi:hypothetical protein
MTLPPCYVSPDDDEAPSDPSPKRVRELPITCEKLLL